MLDTLEFGLPFAENKRNAQALPSATAKDEFCSVVQDELRPWCERFGSTVLVHPIPSFAVSPWEAIGVSTGRGRTEETVPTGDWTGLLRAADEEAASEILIRDGRDGLLVGRLAQRRCWSKTQARLLAQRIVWSHVELLKGHGDA